jgi:hypothetical protein
MLGASGGNQASVKSLLVKYTLQPSLRKYYLCKQYSLSVVLLARIRSEVMDLDLHFETVVSEEVYGDNRPVLLVRQFNKETGGYDDVIDELSRSDARDLFYNLLEEVVLTPDEAWFFANKMQSLAAQSLDESEAGLIDILPLNHLAIP